MIFFHSKFLTLALLVLGFLGSIRGEEQVTICIQTAAKVSLTRDEALAQQFLLFHTFSTLPSDVIRDCQLLFAAPQHLELVGPRDKIQRCAQALGLGLQAVIEQGISQKQFALSKREYAGYLEKSANLHAKILIDEMQWGDMPGMRELLPPIIQKLQAVAEGCDFFESLPLSVKDQQQIEKLIKMMADFGHFKLLVKKKKLEKLGDAIVHVHPLRFIGYIYSQPHLKRRMEKILNGMFKRGGFLNGSGSREGFAQRISREMESAGFSPLLPGFARAVGVEEGEILPFFHAHNWEGLLRYLGRQ